MGFNCNFFIPRNTLMLTRLLPFYYPEDSSNSTVYLLTDIMTELGPFKEGQSFVKFVQEFKNKPKA